jgi:O-antigen ligase
VSPGRHEPEDSDCPARAGGRPGASRAARAASEPSLLSNASAWLWPALPVGACYLACALNGADEAFFALALSATAALLLLSALSTSAGGERLRRIHGLGPPATAFLLTILVVLWSLTPFAPGGPHPLWFYVSGTGAVAIDSGRTGIEIFKLLGLACMFYLGLIFGASDDQARRLRYATLGLGVVYAIWSLAELVRPARAFGQRLSGGLPSPNLAGTVFAALILLSLPLLLRRPRSPDRLSKGERAIGAYGPPAALVLLFGTCLVLTASRGAMLSLAVAVCAFFLLQVLTRKLKLRDALIALVATAALAAIFLLVKGSTAIQRLGEGLTDANGRAPLFAHHWSVFLASPLFGYGLGAFDALNKLTLDAGLYPSVWAVRAAHNVYLQWIEEAGVVGATPMFLCIALIIGKVVRRAGARSRSRSWVTALLAVDVLLLVHGTTDFSLQTLAIAMLWALMLGLQLGMVAPRPVAPVGAVSRLSSVGRWKRGQGAPIERPEQASPAPR